MTNKSKIIDGIQYKQCGTCKQFKPLEDFHKLKHGSLGVMAECKECALQRASEYQKVNPGYRTNRYRNDPEFRERDKKRSREWKQANPRQYKEWCKEHPDYHKEWAKNHPDYFREWQRRFRLKNPDYYRNLRLMKRKA